MNEELIPVSYLVIRPNGSFTLAIFVSENVGDSDTRQSLDCHDSHMTVLALAKVSIYRAILGT